jgi:hypothetical protein
MVVKLVCQIGYGFKNRVLRKIFGPKREDVTGEFNDHYSSTNILGVKIGKNEVGGVCSKYGGAYKDLVGKPYVKRPLVRPRLRWEHDIKMGWGDGLN